MDPRHPGAHSSPPRRQSSRPAFPAPPRPEERDARAARLPEQLRDLSRGQRARVVARDHLPHPARRPDRQEGHDSAPRRVYFQPHQARRGDDREAGHACLRLSSDGRSDSRARRLRADAVRLTLSALQFTFPEEPRMTTELLETIKDGVAVLTMNRPERLNALSRPMLDAMLEALQRLAEDSAVGTLVLTGAGRGFCAGGDVKAMAEGTELGGTTMEEKAQALRSRMETSRLLHEMPKPTIAMVRGAAAGAGLSLALACDLRVASDNARFGTAFARVGYSGDFGGSFFLTQLVGTAKARELYYTAALVDAKEALALGLVNRVVADADLEKETMALATRLAAGPRVALRYMKRNMNAAEAGTLKDLLDLEAWHHTRCGMTEDHREAARAFVEKREPVFKGR